MSGAQFVQLTDRGVVAVSGEDAVAFLQGLVTNDVAAVSDDRTIYAALLTAQGKYLHDFFILRSGDMLYLDCEARRRDDLLRRLTRFRLRARAEIEDVSDHYDMFALFGTEAIGKAGLSTDAGQAAPCAGGIVFVDPRDARLGVRAMLPAGEGAGTLADMGFTRVDGPAYDTLRMSLGIPNGYPEIEPEKSFPMEYGLDAFHGVSFTKGCYVGQEVTVRMKTRGLARKQLVPVRIEGTAPAPGTELILGARNAGELRAACGSTGLALVRIDVLEKALDDGIPFEAGSCRLHPLPSSLR